MQKDQKSSKPSAADEWQKPSQPFLNAFQKEMKDFRLSYAKYQKESGDDAQLPENDVDLFLEWAFEYLEHCDVDLHSGKKPEVLFEKQIHKAESKEHFMKSSHPILKKTWNNRFTSKFLSKLGGLRTENNKLYVIEKVRALSEGNFLGLADLLLTQQTLSFMFFMKHRIHGSNVSIVMCVHIEQIPEFDKGGAVKAFHYTHVLRFLDIVSESDKNAVAKACLLFFNECRIHPARQECEPTLAQKQNKSSVSSYQVYKIQVTQPCFEKVLLMHGEVPLLNDYLTGVQNIPYDGHDSGYSQYTMYFTPNLFEVNYLTPEEVRDLVYNEEVNAWVFKKAYSLFLKKRENAITAKLNAEVIQRFADFESSAKLVDLLEKMKDLKLKLTPEEKKLIGQSGNVLAIGRSGTGKTTCSVLRLFSQDMLFKLRLGQAQIKQGILRDTRFTEEFDNLIGIHSIFVTASPVLTNEVSRYYKNLSNRIKNEMKKKEEKRRAEKGIVIVDQKEESKSEFEVISEITMDKNADQNGEEEVKEEEQEEVFNEEDYLVDEEEAQLLSKMNKNYSLEDIDEKEFPLFLTVKRLILMIDGTLQRPFFERKKDHSIIGFDSQAQWHNEMKGMMMINNKFRSDNEEDMDNAEVSSPSKQKDDENMIKEEDSDEEEESGDENGTGIRIDDADIEKEYERYQAILKKKREQAEQESLLRKKNKMSFEVDYEYFLNHFWLEYLQRQDRPSGMSPIILWSEIISNIKGSAESHLRPGFYLSEAQYTELQKESSTFLNQDNRRTIYKLFCRYEEWKTKEGGYDFMDVTNHALNEIRLRGYNGVPIHFIMIDEVQDLSHAAILLLMKVTEQNVFLAGDTAQTIAKGVGVKFADLSSLFKFSAETEREEVERRPTVHQLTVNFRSHGKILDIANSVVTLMETYFPKTIDRLKKEKSEVDGPKPILLEDVDIEVLFTVLFGTENFKSHRHSQKSVGALEKPPIEFGCNQAIIVRDQESKNKLPPLLKHALCLTVYEAKGLEFDDVILYNFFSESQLTPREWELLGLLEVEEKEVEKEIFDRHYFTYKEESLADLKGGEDIMEASFERITGPNDDLDLQAPNLFGMQLDEKSKKYVMKKVTLPKKYYQVYDYFENYGMVCNEFKQLYVALTRPRNRIVIFDDNVEKRAAMERYWKDLNLVQVVSKNILETQTQASNENKDVESFKSLIASTSADEWKKQGLKMFRNKYYEQAVKCFEKALDEPLKNRAEAYMIAEKASNTLRQIKADQNALMNEQKEQTKVKDTESKERKAKIKQLKKDEKTCLEDFEKAAHIFKGLELFKQAAKCYFSAEAYESALELYEKIGLYREAGEACFMLKQHEKTAELFLKGQDYIRALECLELVNDHKKILEVLENLQDIPVQQRKYYVQKYLPLVLKNLTEQLEMESPAAPPVQLGRSLSSTLKKNESPVKVESDEEEEEKAVEPIKNVSEISFEVIGASKNISEISLDINQVEDSVENFEHLENIDEEFLGNDSASIIDSLLVLRKEKSISYSDYSVFDEKFMIDTNYHIVKTKADTFVHNSIMEKIIQYLSMFSADFKDTLSGLRSRKALLTESIDLENKSIFPTVTENIIDLDKVSLDFVYLILDFLEQCNLYKLCIYVCNRYQLANKLGRYLADIALRYSPVSTQDIKANFTKLYPPRNRQILLEKAFVANTALHNVLEIINPQYLQLKKKGEICDDKNSLGDSCFSALISLGFWKKCLFLMDYQNSLGLASTFASFENYKMIFLTGSDEYKLSKEDVKQCVESSGFKFLPFEAPSNADETKAAIIGLESVAWELAERLPTHLYKHYKPITGAHPELKVPAFPSYFACNEALWNFLVKKDSKKLEECFNRAVENIIRGAERKEKNRKLELFDSISFVLQIVLYYSTQPTVSDFIHKLPVPSVNKLMVALRKIAEHTFAKPSSSIYEETIIKAILSAFRVRFIENASVLKSIGRHNYLVHISSPIMHELLAANPSASPVLIYDIEANFVLAKISSCLGGIRAQIAEIMKTIIAAQLKGERFSRNIKQAHEIHEDQKEFLEERASILGEFSCLEYCSLVEQKIESPVEKKKGSPSPQKPKKKEEIKIEDDRESEEDEDHDYDKLENQGKKSNRLTIKPKSAEKPSVVVSAKTSSKVIGGAAAKNVNTQGPKDKSQILKEFKDITRGFLDIKIDAEYYGRTELLAYGIQKLKKYLKKQKVKQWIVHFFYLIGRQSVLAEVLRKNAKNNTAQKLQLYSDAIYYRKFLCSSEYTNNAFEFISSSFKVLSLSNLLFVLGELTNYVLIASSINKKASSEVKLILNPGEKGSSKTEHIDISNIVALQEDSLNEAVHWVNKVTDRLAKEKITGDSYFRLVAIILNILANTPKLSDESAQSLQEALTVLLQNESAHFLDKTYSASEVDKNDFSDRITKHLQSFKIKNTKLLQNFYQGLFKTTVSVKASPQAAKNAEACEKAWNRDQGLIAKRIIIQKKLRKLFLKKRSGLPLRERVILNISKTTYPLELIDTDNEAATKELQGFLIRSNAKIDTFEEFENVFRAIMNYYGGNVIDVALDFHYISSLLLKVVDAGEEYLKNLQELFQIKEGAKIQKEALKNQAKALEDIVEEFTQWSTHKKAKVEEKVNKRQKFVRAKWEEDALMLKMKEVAKKRKNIKKQEFQLKQKALQKGFKR